MSSSTNESPQVKRNLHDSRNITTILPPEITSTPFISNKTKAASPLITPTRKFLGPRRYALSNNGVLNPVKTIKDPPGPLLATTPYNLNVSTYIDAKSPGYSGRLVQYNEESSQKQQHTHQEKYGSPGLLPIVHLFKKDVPVISPKIKKGTIRIGTPESRAYYSQEQSRMLLDGIVRNSSILKEQNNSNEVSTRSVLDALKEISRKRIHANEEYDPIDDSNKKFRKANGDGDYLKRNRVESPPSEKSNNSSPTTQAKKRLCTIDAVLASKTSSMYGTFEGGTKRKSNEDSNNKILPMNKKKYNTVETQTLGTPVTTKDSKNNTVVDGETDDKTSEKILEKPDAIEEISSPPKQVLKVLDDKPLEVIRKNRLGALLSALSGREIPSIPMEDRRKALDQEWPTQSSEKPLVSILSSQNKHPKSDEKHVTFNLLQNTQSTSSTVIPENKTTTTNPEKEEKIKTVQNEKSSEISFGSVPTESAPKAISSDDKAEKNVLNTFSINQKSDKEETKTEEKEKSVGGFKFDLSKPINLTSGISSSPSSSKIVESNPKIEFKSSVNFSSPSSTSANFMFGTSPSKTESLPAKTTFDNSFTKSPSAAPPTNSLGLPTSLPIASSTLTPGAGSTSSSFTFGTKPSTEVNSTTTKIADKTAPVFAFGKDAALLTELGKSSMTTLTSEKAENAGNITSPFGSKTVASVGNASPVFPFKSMNNISAKSSNVPGTCSSSTTPTMSNIPQFSSSTSTLSTIPNSSAAGTTSNSTFAFNSTPASSETTTNLGSTTTPGGFKFGSANSLPAFGSPSASSVPSMTTSNAFSTQTNVMATSKAPVENTSGTNNPFISAPTNTGSSSMFGNNAASNNSFTSDKKTFTFGSTGNQNNATSSSATSTFTFKTSQSGVTATNTSASTASKLPFGSAVPTFGTSNNMFSTTKTTPVPSFGAPTTTSTFGTSNSLAFGKTSTPNSTTPLFGTTNTPSFGTTSSSTFGTTNSTFGTSNTPNFGAANAPSFGTTNTPSFGTTNTSTFGSTANNLSFGTASTPGFGTTNTPSFSTANTSNTFGSTNTPTFGTTSSSTFGTSNAPSFGNNNTPAFGTTNTPAFGTTNTPAFGTINTLAFGTSTSSSANVFGATSTAVTGFGTNNSAFGTPKTSGFGTTNTPTFGNATTTASFGTSFSSTSTLNAPSFGNPSSPFGNAMANNTTTFNSNNAASPFGNSGTNSFGTFNSNNSQFPAVTSAPSFGTNANNTFGSSSATNAFGSGSSATNTFGSGNNATNTFGSSNASSPFGTNANSASSGFGSSFGKKPEQSSSIFPAANNNMFNSTSTFGSAPTNNNGNAGGSSTSGVFTFGSPNTSAPSSGGVFTFGATEPPKTFNFSAPGTSDNNATSAFNSVPSFAQPGPAVPNMFSIGSGNTTAPQARGRQLVRARRRT